MGLDIFFLEDIRSALQAADQASTSTARVCATVSGYEASPEADVTLRAYLEGYRAALTTVALAFGLSPAVIAGQRPSTGSGRSSGQGETLEVQARTVSEALPSGGQDDAAPSAISHRPSARRVMF